jgi:hypothetical protein
MQINVEYSNYHKSLKFNIDGKEYDISSEVPEKIWNIGGRMYPINPIDDWKTRKELRKIFIKYFKKNIDKNLNTRDVVF